MKTANLPAALRDESFNLFYRLPGIHPLLERRFDYHVLRHRYRRVFGRYPNLSEPQRFSEKVIHRRLYDRRPLLTRVADKVRVRDYVSERIGHDYLPELFAVEQDPGVIAWDALPPRFVAKANHGCGYNIVVDGESAFDRGAAIETLRARIGAPFYLHSREWCYRDIDPLVFVEEYL